MKIRLYPRIVNGRDDIEPAGRQYALGRQDRNPVADGVERVQIVRNQKDGQAQGIAQREYELVKFAGTEGIESRRGFIQK
jgi:hypothetical protein